MRQRSAESVPEIQNLATHEADDSAPTRHEIVQMVSEHMYSETILNNAHRGDVVEMMVLAALRPDWRFVGLGWHPWDLQRGDGEERLRIQVKQSAALQLWGPTVKPVIKFGWKPKPPSYFARDNPGVHIEAEGWFCDIFVVGLHDVVNASAVDQLDPRQWEFLVIPTGDLKPRTNSMALSKALGRWKPVRWHELRSAVEQAAEPMAPDGNDWCPRQDSNLRRTV